MAAFDKAYIKSKLKDNGVIIFKMRPSRIKMKQAAILEVFLLLKEHGAQFIPNGPLGDIKGVFSFFIPLGGFARAAGLLPRMGYCSAAYIADFTCEPPVNETPLQSINPLLWKGNPFTLHKLYELDEALYEAHSPHNRVFSLLCEDGITRAIKGYRGDGGELSRRALPVEDARLLANLTGAMPGDALLDPFAGAGGIIYEAVSFSIRCHAADIDPALRPGLEAFGASVCISDVAALDYPCGAFAAIATEAPFAPSSTGAICAELHNLCRMLKSGGLMSLMCAEHQAGAIKATAMDCGFTLIYAAPLDRKGTDVHIMLLSNGANDELSGFVSSISLIR